MTLKGVRKQKSPSPKPVPSPPRSPDRYFWYTASDDVARIVTTADGCGVPLQQNSYVFHKSKFAHQPYPESFPDGAIWPPQTVDDLLCAIGPASSDCVGNQCLTDTVCTDPFCSHTLSEFQKSSDEWKDSFELRKTPDRGFGIFAKQSFKAGVVLGWYAGEVKVSGTLEYSDYFMELNIGVVPRFEDSECWEDEATDKSSLVLIDAGRKGNWTRFINHSCDPHAEFRIRRVGNMRIMTVESIKEIAEGDEVTVSYGASYYGPTSVKMCYCGASNCVGEKRRKTLAERQKQIEEGTWSRVKRCVRREP